MKEIGFTTEQRKVKDLLPYEHNPRKITAKMAEKLRESLEKFGLAEIPVVNTDNTLVAGHQRVKILMLLGRGEDVIDVRVPKRPLTEKELQEYNILSNKIKGEFDFDMLANNFDLDDLQNWGFEKEELGIGDYQPNGKEDEIPEEVGDYGVAVGDVFKCGEHFIVCGDSTDPESYNKVLKDDVKLVFTSPPYNMGGDMYKNYHDKRESDDYIQFNLNVVNAVKPHLKGFLFWNISYNKRTRSEFIDILYRLSNQANLRFLELIVWNKKHALPITSKHMLTRQYEDIFVFSDEDSVKDMEMYFLGENDRSAYFIKKKGRGITNYWEVGTNNTQLKDHKACFPVELPAKAIELTTLHNDIVVDPFLGSGSTMIACENMGRKCVGIELDPYYVNVALTRFEKYTGIKPEKVINS